MTESSAPTSFADLLASRAISAQRVTFQATVDWQQGRTLFGGVLSALTAQAMRDICGSDWPMRALQTNFIGPVNPGPFHVDVTLLRQGKNIRQVKAILLQPDEQGVEQICGILLGVFGMGRSSQVPQREPTQEPVARDAQTSTVLPFLPGLTPNFTQHIDMRMSEGAFPFTGSDNWRSRYHLRLKNAEGVDAELTSILLADAGFTPALSQAKTMAPASSVSWALELRTVDSFDPSGLWRLDQDTVAFDEGYANDKAFLWTPDGQLAALGYQVVAVYA